MVFIQAWRLQAQPPHWQLGVNFPLLALHINHPWVLSLWRGGEPPASAVATIPHPWYLEYDWNSWKNQHSRSARQAVDLCNTELCPLILLLNQQETFLIQIWANIFISDEVKHKAANVCKFPKRQTLNDSLPMWFRLSSRSCLWRVRRSDVSCCSI